MLYSHRNTHSYILHIILKSQLIQHQWQIYCFTVVITPLLLLKFVVVYVYPPTATEKFRAEGEAPPSS